MPVAGLPSTPIRKFQGNNELETSPFCVNKLAQAGYNFRHSQLTQFCLPHAGWACARPDKGEGFMNGRWLLLFLGLAVGSMVGQTFRGTILGTVTDPSGAVVSGAKVTVKNVNTGLERTTQTSADGSYSVP